MKRRRLAALAAAMMALAWACGRSRGGAPDVPAQHRGRVFVIGLDGADWEIVDRLSAEGRLPNLTRLRGEGAWGILRSEEPLLSPIVWTTIATGRPPTDHGIVGFLTERDGRTEPVRSDERRIRAFWNVASDYDVSVGVVGWYASWPAEPVRGFLVSDRVGSHQVEGAAGPASDGLAWPRSIVPEIASLRDAVDRDVTPSTAARFFSAGGAPGGATVPIERDRLDTFVGILRTTELYRRLVPKLDEEFHPALTAVYFEGTDAVGHLFAEYEPPPLPWTTAEQREHLGTAFGRYYDYVDTVVGELVSRIDRATTTVIVVSDHGFRTGARRPRMPSRSAYGNQAPLWHRPEGIVLLWGRGIRAGTRLPEASIYDVLPTILRLLDLPIAATLRGRPIDAGLSPDVLARPARDVEDYEARGKRTLGEAGDGEDDATMAKLRSLGYVGGGSDASGTTPPDDAGQAAVPLNRYNRALILLNAGHGEDALREFRALQRDAPRFALGFLGEGLVRLRDGDARGAVTPLETAVRLDPRLAVAHADLGEAYLGSGRADEGRRALEHSLELDASQGRPALLLAEALADRRDLTGAARWFASARRLADDPSDRARASVGLAVLAEEGRRFDEAERLYDDALSVSPDLPAALERYGNLELYRGRAARAVDLLGRLVAAHGDSPPVLALYARALLTAGRRDDARAEADKALARDPGSADARAVRDELDAGARRR